MAEPIEVTIEYLPEWTDANALVIPLGNDLYRLARVPMWPTRLDLTAPARDRLRPTPRERKHLPDFGDVIEARPGEAGVLHFIRVVERAGVPTALAEREAEGGGAASGDAV